MKEKTNKLIVAFIISLTVSCTLSRKRDVDFGNQDLNLPQGASPTLYGHVPVGEIVADQSSNDMAVTVI